MIPALKIYQKVLNTKKELVKFILGQSFDTDELFYLFVPESYQMVIKTTAVNISEYLFLSAKGEPLLAVQVSNKKAHVLEGYFLENVPIVHNDNPPALSPSNVGTVEEDGGIGMDAVGELKVGNEHLNEEQKALIEKHEQVSKFSKVCSEILKGYGNLPAEVGLLSADQLENYIFKQLLERGGWELQTAVKKEKEVFDIAELKEWAGQVLEQAFTVTQYEPKGNGGTYKTPYDAEKHLLRFVFGVAGGIKEMRQELLLGKLSCELKKEEVSWFKSLVDVFDLEFKDFKNKRFAFLVKKEIKE